MSELQDRLNSRNPDLVKTPPATVTPTTVAPQSTAPSSPLQDRLNSRNPAPGPVDQDLTKENFWNLPPGVSQGQYWGAEGRLMGHELLSAASNVARAYTDDYTMGTSDIARAAETGEPLEKVRADTEAAKADLGASRYGVSAMAAITPNPVGWLAKGARIANAIEKPIVNVVGPLGKKVASGIGRFIEGGAYTGAQDVGHGQTDNLTRDMLAGGAFTAGVGGIGDTIPAAGKWARERWTGTPEASPQGITNATQGDPFANANAEQFEKWRSNNQHGKPPSQGDIETHATSLYGDDMARWPPEMRTLYQAAGGGNKTLINRALTFAGSQATAGAVTGGSYLMGAPLDPVSAAAIHGVAGYVGDSLAPAINRITGGPPTVGRAILDAYPALTGMRVPPSAPNAAQDWTKLTTGLANPSTPSSTPQPFFPWAQ